MGKASTIDDYINSQEQWKKDILLKLHKIVKENAPTAEEAIKWSQPVYSDNNGPFCFIRAHKNHINIGFWRGAMMRDTSGLLEGTGEKMRHIKIMESTKINSEAIADFVIQAVRLNRKFGNPTRN